MIGAGSISSMFVFHAKGLNGSLLISVGCIL